MFASSTGRVHLVQMYTCETRTPRTCLLGPLGLFSLLLPVQGVLFFCHFVLRFSFYSFLFLVQGPICNMVSLGETMWIKTALNSQRFTFNRSF